jgi:thiol peroxidase
MLSTAERANVTTFRERPVTLLGAAVGVGDPAPDFTVLAGDMSPVTLASSRGAVRVISSVPSLETPVCDRQTRRFTEEAAGMDGVAVLTVSVDLPFAQARWCGAAGLPDARTLSDHRDLSFGLAYGVAIKELRLLARAVFVIDADDRVAHAEYVPAIEREPDYAAALAAARTAAAPGAGGTG